MKQPVITLSESCVPSLQSGDYEVEVCQRTDLLGSSESLCQDFRIEGPRFSLGDADIQSVYPPANMRGGFGLSLPHMVLNRKTLLWERSMEQDNSQCYAAPDAPPPSGVLPWMAVLLLQGDEITDIQSDTVSRAITPPEGVFFPRLILEDEQGGEMCRYIDINRSLFLNILPSREELPLLCHARQVSREFKANGSISDNEWVSVIIGNRLPSSSEAGVKNRIYLVSLEGYGHIADSPDPHMVRLIVLHSWDFVSVSETFHFRELLANLSFERLRLPAGSQAKELSSLAANGFVPVSHTMRNGSRSVAFYRGPLVPNRTKEVGYKSFCSDMLYRYDPSIGMFDISHACAWQMGRLIALSNPAVVQNIMKQRTASHSRAHRRAEECMMAGGFNTAINDPKIGTKLINLMSKTLKNML